MENESKVQVPTAPAILPADLQSKWAKDYREAYERHAEENVDLSEGEHHGHAAREANRVLRVPAPKSISDVEKLPKWQILARREKNGKLSIVTADGKKYEFTKGGSAPAENKDKEQSSNGAGQQQKTA
jgi:hypothetical protein